MNEVDHGISGEAHDGVGADRVVEEKVRQLNSDAEYLAGIDRSQLSPEDKQAYDELVALRTADYKENSEKIRLRLEHHIRANDADRQDRISAGDHNVR